MQLAMIGLGRMGANMVRRLHQGRPSVRGLRHVAEGGRRFGAREGGRGVLARGPRAQAREAAGGLVDGPGGGRGQDHRRPRASPRERRHPHRRRQLLLRGRHPPRQRARAERHQLRGCRNQRRRLGLGARILHDDRRTGGGRAAPRSDLQDAGARRRATSRARLDARRSAAPPSWATCTAARTAPVTSSRWSTTASSTASWPLMRKG